MHLSDRGAEKHWAEILWPTETFWAQISFVIASSSGIRVDEVDSRPTKWKKIWICLWWAEIELLDAYTACPWGLFWTSPNVKRPISAAEINLITICKCYSCFTNRPGWTLEACIYIHTHEPKAQLNADMSELVEIYICCKCVRAKVSLE